MTALLAPFLLATALVATAIAGPMLVRAAAAALMRVPRAAVALLLGAGVLWLFAGAALSLMLAWLVTGPAVLPAKIAGVCQRCLAAASPFSSIGMIDTVVPAALLILLPAAGLAALVGTAAFRGLRRRRATAAAASDVAGRTEPAIIRGYAVLLTSDPQPSAYSLPRRHGGIVVSRGLISLLQPDELAAVLAHEREHVRGHHHLARAVLDVLVAPLRWLPLMSAIRNAVPHYLEIAADDAAQRHAGTTALASALLKLGGPYTAAVAPESATAGVILHAAGPDRIGHLISPPRIGPAIAPIAALGATAVGFAVLTAMVHVPYISVVVAGCHLPV